MGSLKDDLHQLSQKENFFLHGEIEKIWGHGKRILWVEKEVTNHHQKHPEAEEKPSLLKEVEAMLQAFNDLPWYQRWRNQSLYERLHEAYVHLQLEELLKGFDTHFDAEGKIVLDKANPFEFYQMAFAIAHVRHSYSLWNVAEWWRLRILESRLKREGKHMQKYQQERDKLLEQWQGLCKQIQFEAAQFMAELADNIDVDVGDVFDQTHKAKYTKEVLSLYEQWVEKSWFNVKDSEANRLNRDRNVTESYIHMQRLTRALTTINGLISPSKIKGVSEQEETIEIEESDGKPNNEVRLQEELSLLGRLLREGLHLNKPHLEKGTKNEGNKVWKLFKQLGEGILMLAKKAEEKGLEKKGIVGWWHKTAGWLPEILTPAKKKLSGWKVLGGNKKEEPPLSSPHFSIVEVKQRLEKGKWQEVWQEWQKKIASVKGDYQQQEKSDKLEGLYSFVVTSEDDFRRALKQLITVGIQEEIEGQHVEELFNSLPDKIRLLKANIEAYWRERNGVEEIDIAENNGYIPEEELTIDGEDGQEKQASSPTTTSLDDIDGVVDNDIFIQLGDKGKVCCRELGLTPDEQGVIAWSEVKKAYHQLARQNHPDKTGKPSSEAFNQVATAFAFIEGLKNGEEDFGYCTSAEADEQFANEVANIMRDQAELRKDFAELREGWKEVNNELGKLVEETEEIKREQEKIRQGFQETKQVFQETKQVFQGAKEQVEDMDVRIQKLQERKRQKAEKKENQRERKKRSPAATPHFWKSDVEPQATGDISDAPLAGADNQEKSKEKPGETQIPHKFTNSNGTP